MTFVGGRGLRWTKDVKEEIDKDAGNPPPPPSKCTKCQGTGAVRHGFTEVACSTCMGTGKI